MAESVWSTLLFPPSRPPISCLFWTRYARGGLQTPSIIGRQGRKARVRKEDLAQERKAKTWIRQLEKARERERNSDLDMWTRAGRAANQYWEPCTSSRQSLGSQEFGYSRTWMESRWPRPIGIFRKQLTKDKLPPTIGRKGSYFPCPLGLCNWKQAWKCERKDEEIKALESSLI